MLLQHNILELWSCFFFFSPLLKVAMAAESQQESLQLQFNVFGGMHTLCLCRFALLPSSVVLGVVGRWAVTTLEDIHISPQKKISHIHLYVQITRLLPPDNERGNAFYSRESHQNNQGHGEWCVRISLIWESTSLFFQSYWRAKFGRQGRCVGREHGWARRDVHLCSCTHKHKPASVPALFAVPTAVSAASVSVSAPPLPLSAPAARGGTAVVAVLFVPLRCNNCTH